MDIARLAAELDPAQNPGGHPVTGPYSLNNATAAAEMNAVNLTITRDEVGGDEILNGTDDGEFDQILIDDPANGQADQNQWIGLCGIVSIDTASGVAKSLEKSLFGPGTQTRTNLAALRFRDAYRGEQPDLAIGITAEGHVEQARAQ
jgi:hypothetical protein